MGYREPAFVAHLLRPVHDALRDHGSIQRLGGIALDGRDLAYVFGPLCLPGIVSGLHPRPDSRTIPEKLAEAYRDGRRYRLSFLQHVVQMLTRNPEQSGDLCLGAAGGRNDVIAK